MYRERERERKEHGKQVQKNTQRSVFPYLFFAHFSKCEPSQTHPPSLLTRREKDFIPTTLVRVALSQRVLITVPTGKQLWFRSKIPQTHCTGSGHSRDRASMVERADTSATKLRSGGLGSAVESQQGQTALEAACSAGGKCVFRRVPCEKPRYSGKASFSGDGEVFVLTLLFGTSVLQVRVSGKCDLFLCTGSLLTMLFKVLGVCGEVLTMTPLFDATLERVPMLHRVQQVMLAAWL